VLVALAQLHSLMVLTSDENIPKYPGVKTVWCRPLVGATITAIEIAFQVRTARIRHPQAHSSRLRAFVLRRRFHLAGVIA
jgi:PIN domain nuclease of toxin-antitoxin system